MRRNKKTPLVELKLNRTNYGNDETAINRHSERLYIHDKRLYALNKNLSCLPPCYSLCEIRLKNGDIVDGLTDVICIEGQNYWGSGIPWSKAERLVMTTLGAAGISRNTDDEIFGHTVPGIAKK
jgi:hypothetical protein